MKLKRILAFTVVLLCTALLCLPQVDFPWKDVYIGALEADSWAGLIFAPHRESLFGFRLRIIRAGDSAEGGDLLYLVSEVGPHAEDGRYTRIKFDLSLPFGMREDTPILTKPSKGSQSLIMEWSRQDENTVVGRIQAPKSVEIELIHYFPWNFKGGYRLSRDGYVQGESIASIPYHYLLWTNREGRSDSDVGASIEQISINFPMNKSRRIYFAAGVDGDEQILKNHIYRYKNIHTIDTLLKEEEKRHEKNRIRINGLFQGTEKALTNNLFWSMLYQPGNHRFYSPPGRDWILPRSDGNPDYWTIFEWDSFLNALQVAVESKRHASDVINSVLGTQYPTGNVPNWRGGFGGTSDRSQPPIGSYVILKLFQRFGDYSILKSAYPYLIKWHAYWKQPLSGGRIRRDGNRDGLLEWGSDRDLVSSSLPEWEKSASGKQRAQWESGQSDLPNWKNAGFDEKTGTLTMNCVDLNSLYALDAWCLAQIANVLELDDDHKAYLDEYERMKTLINSELWNERESFYFDKHWSGEFSQNKAASNFYPLLAGIPNEDQALRMVSKHLLNEKEFWGEFVIPSVSKDDPEYIIQQYWKGAVWPPLNYLIFQALKANGFDAVASELVRKSADLFMRTWNNFQLSSEYFDSRTGEAGGHRYQNWGSLLALMAIEEYMDFTPKEGFRFGVLDPEKKGEIFGLSFQDRHYDLKVSQGEISLREMEREIFKTNGGAVIRQFLYSENEISFRMRSLEKREVWLRFLVKGRYQLYIDNELKSLFKGSSTKFDVDEGEHSILILLLERL